MSLNILTLTAFFIFVGGIFLYFDISPFDLVNELFKWIENRNKKKNISQQIKDINSKKRDSFFVSLIKETKELLRVTNKTEKFSNLCMGSFVCMIIGIYLSVYMNNFYLIPILSIGFATLPFQYVKLTSLEYKKAISNELEVALSVITSSYIRSDNMVLAIRENLSYIKPPIRNVFEAFNMQIEFISSDIPKLLGEMREKIDDDIFREWVDEVISCQHNRGLKSTLNPIVSKLSDMKALSSEVNNELYKPLNEFFGMLVIVYINFPLLYFLNKDWFKTLMFTTPGKIVISIIVVITFISFSGIMKHTKPIDSSILNGE